jgi:hypothetical protein
MQPVKVIALACALAFGAVACGSGADDAARNRRWAKRFCTSLSEWQDATTSSSSALQEFLKDPNLDTTTAKARLTQYLQETTDATDELVDDLRRAGMPAISERRRAVATLQKGSAAVKRAITDAKTKVDSLPVDDPEQFRVGTQSANSTLSRGFETFDDALTRVNRLDADGDLLEAERSVSKCRPLVS